MRRAVRVVLLLMLTACGTPTPASPSVEDRLSIDPPYMISHILRDDLPDTWLCPKGTCLDTATWHPITSDWAVALRVSEGGDWTGCYLSVGDTTFVACPDGRTWTS